MPTEQKFKIEIKRDLCCGYGVCKEICPDVFQLGDDGLVTVLCDTVSGDGVRLAREAADGCPQSVITLSEIE